MSVENVTGWPILQCLIGKASNSCSSSEEGGPPVGAGIKVGWISDSSGIRIAATGSRTFTKEYVCTKVRTWSDEIKWLAEVAISQTQVTYVAFTHGLTSLWMCVLRTIADPRWHFPWMVICTPVSASSSFALFSCSFFHNKVLRLRGIIKTTLSKFTYSA